MYCQFYPGRHVESRGCENAERAARNTGEARSTPHVASWRRADAIAGAIMAGQLGRLSSKPARPRPLSHPHLVAAADATLAESHKGHHGLCQCDGISTLPRSYRRVSGHSSRRALRRIADPGDNWLTAGLAAIG